MLRLIGNVIFGVGYVVGWIKYSLGIFVVIPERYRSAGGASKKASFL